MIPAYPRMIWPHHHVPCRKITTQSLNHQIDGQREIYPCRERLIGLNRNVRESMLGGHNWNGFPRIRVVFWWLRIITNTVIFTASTGKLIVNRVLKQTVIWGSTEAIIQIVVTPIRGLLSLSSMLLMSPTTKCCPFLQHEGHIRCDIR